MCTCMLPATAVASVRMTLYILIMYYFVVCTLYGSRLNLIRPGLDRPGPWPSLPDMGVFNLNQHLGVYVAW